MSSILILGASGLLGRTLVDFFKDKNHTIGVLSRNPIHYTEPNIEVHSVDILEYNSLDSVIQKYKTIINCTGQITNPINLSLLLNTDGISNIVKAVKKHDKRLIHISSVAVYGEAEYVNEESHINPQTPYGSFKYFSEYIVKSNLKNYSILRVSNLFGKHQEKGIINYLTKSYLNNTPNVHFNNDGSLKRYYLHIKDLSSIINEIMKINLSGTYNIIGSECLNIKELVKRFEDILNYKYFVNYSEDLAIENIDKIDDSKIKSITDTTPKVDMNKYIEELKR
ncbi:NAD-dependent epimerase/dehydratase [Sulfurimonas gotlandica GD1]|uniref:dTDP-4-dehydrorhamnose reductase n=1 Tax=Sulfurimonas gotlandica (strain DSM 19862 / JCM 16533 / GD1) TaxID=929558 RepID=B6BGD7_SULGG|nr:NAD(P)-dependent oxidoreductase [Sulfurimonas gotlandica]EDZ63220.1 UDP-glucose 4-epimerase, putative [Sulfurimonas gotlandica GD1]EHP29564.1 NAD-dependent epimerase/dehydratase [Sulfurimonas gotlandica GD1]